jgi:hypothetical protein
MESETMTYQQDPNEPRRDTNTGMNRDMRRDAGYGSWVVGGLVAVAVIAGIFAFFGRDDSNTTASTTPERPAAGAPATTPSPSPGTTGSGSTSPPPAAR